MATAFFITFFAILSLIILPLLGVGGKYQSVDEINKYKSKLSYNDEGFTIHTYRDDYIVKWETIEAIFLKDSPPLDGEYHNKQYQIILNKNPVEIRKTSLKWYNKIIPTPKQEKYPIIRIDDYYNIHFYTFHSAVEKYLINRKISSDYLRKRFGYIPQKENITINMPTQRLISTMEFYTIFDRENLINDERLINYRKTAKVNA